MLHRYIRHISIIVKAWSSSATSKARCAGTPVEARAIINSQHMAAGKAAGQRDPSLSRDYARPWVQVFRLSLVLLLPSHEMGSHNDRGSRSTLLTAAEGRRFGVDQGAPPCDGAGCRVCSICRGRFEISRAGSGRLTGGLLRYGRGAYFSSVSSKSDDYAGSGVAAAASAPGEPRVMFLCKVAAGRVFRAASPSMAEAAVLAAMAQQGCHSLLGERPAGGGEGGGGFGVGFGGGGGFILGTRCRPLC